MSYIDYIGSSRWKRKRDEIIKRANGVCERCGKRKATNVHHITYRHIGDEPGEDLEALCRHCHRKAHNLNKDDIKQHPMKRHKKKKKSPYKTSQLKRGAHQRALIRAFKALPGETKLIRECQ